MMKKGYFRAEHEKAHRMGSVIEWVSRMESGLNNLLTLPDIVSLGKRKY